MIPYNHITTGNASANMYSRKVGDTNEEFHNFLRWAEEIWDACVRSIAAGDRWWPAARATTNLAAVVEHKKAHASQPFKSFQLLLPLTTTDYSSTVALSTGAPNVRVASLRNSNRAFSQPMSCSSMARVGWRLVTKHIWPPLPADSKMCRCVV